MLLDSGRDCPRCEDRQVVRRAQCSAVAAAVKAAMPHASEAERRAEVDRQLHQRVTAQAWAREQEWEQVRSRKPTAAHARAEVAAAQVAAPAEPVAPVVVPAPRPATVTVLVVDDGDQEQQLVLEDLTREQVIDWRARAAHDPQVVFDHIDRYGETSARRLFTSKFADQVQRLAGLGHLGLGYTPWEPA
ncbi:hypothetical protein ACIP3A_39450 [Streptomyces tricolor]|uniref:hypothetical protein n=1 Tax=Streptomyces tricolor TaxID=68277 RepID=UPI0037F2B41B